MIKFFRKIRQNLIAERKTAKYLKYAVGEIILVVIGILIALQINNWNERRIKSTLEKAYIKSLYADLVEDTSYYQSKILETDFLISSYDTFIHKVYAPQKNLQEYRSLMKNVDFPPNELTTHNSTYIELLSTGNLNILKDNSLKKAIINLYKNFGEINTHIRDYDNIANARKATVHEKVMFVKYMELKRNELPWDQDYMFSDEDWNYINNPASVEFRSFEELIGLYYNKCILSMKYLMELKTETANLMEQINQSKK